MLQAICLWIWIIAGFLVDVIMLSYILFGGKIQWSITLYGPLRFLSKRDDDGQ
jgi:hypothetical protein